MSWDALLVVAVERLCTENANEIVPFVSLEADRHIDRVFHHRDQGSISRSNLTRAHNLTYHLPLSVITGIATPETCARLSIEVDRQPSLLEWGKNFSVGKCLP